MRGRVDRPPRRPCAGQTPATPPRQHSEQALRGTLVRSRAALGAQWHRAPGVWSVRPFFTPRTHTHTHHPSGLILINCLLWHHHRQPRAPGFAAGPLSCRPTRALIENRRRRAPPSKGPRAGTSGGNQSGGQTDGDTPTAPTQNRALREANRAERTVSAGAAAAVEPLGGRAHLLSAMCHRRRPAPFCSASRAGFVRCFQLAGQNSPGLGLGFRPGSILLR